MNKFSFITFLLIIMVIVSCSDDDPVSPPEAKPTALNAKAGLNQEAEINETVNLDGSESTGPSGFTYSWAYDGPVAESDINFQNKTSALPKFVPPVPGFYEFTLTITDGDSSDSDDTSVLVGGAIELGGVLTQNLALENIQPDESYPDYIVTSDLIVEAGIVLSIIEDDVRIQFQQGTGLHIKSGGSFTNMNEQNIFGYESEFYGDDGWKGILVENGELFLNDSKLVNAGADVFTGQSEPAVVSFVGEETRLINLRYNEFINSQSYDILSLDKIGGSGVVVNNQFSYKHPLKVAITFMGFFAEPFPNYFPEDYEYVILVPSGSDKMDVPHKGRFMFETEGKYYIDGDFWAGEMIYIEANAKIFMKEGAAILAQKKVLARVFPQTPIEIEGINGAEWKGIASNFDSYLGFELENVTIKNAGYGKIKMGDFEAEAEATLHLNSQGSVLSSKIINSGGYGIYFSNPEMTSFDIRRTHFEKNKLGAVRTSPKSVGRIFRFKHECTFNLEPEVAACLVQTDNEILDYWYALGGDNYYLIDCDIQDDNSFRINEGTILKFKSGRSINWTNTANWISFAGTEEEPIIIDSELGTPGSWGGIFIGSSFGMSHTTVRNGGEFQLPSATEIANVVIATLDEESQFLGMKNTKIENSAGYGIVVEANSKEFDYENPENQNTFNNNSSGDVLVKP